MSGSMLLEDEGGPIVGLSGEASSRATLVRAAAWLARAQREDGFWVFDLEADATIPAEYVLLEHFMDRVTPDRQRRIGLYLRRKRDADGGWPLFAGGSFDLSASVKAYFALKLIGDPPDAPHMREAREAILAAGGAECSNVFTRIQLALFGEVPWRAVPMMPVELMLLPRGFPISIWDVSYWSRTCIVPLLVIQALKPAAKNPSGLGISELFRRPPHGIRDWLPAGELSRWTRLFNLVDKLLRTIEPIQPAPLRRRAVAKAIEFVEERLNGEDGLGAIYPAMGYAAMMYAALGHGPDDPAIRTVWGALDRLIVERSNETFCQPCLSPVWDTGLAAHALAEAREAGLPVADQRIAAACDWLAARQITDCRGDWSVAKPEAAAGGWAFQYRNDHYPDVDDTAVVAMLLLREAPQRYADCIERARIWVLAMQGRDGGWGAFDIDNDRAILNHIPFADHGALLDPPTVDVTARCISFLAKLANPADIPAIDRAVAFLLRNQEEDGSWFGRWGCNYIYGTWSALSALKAAGRREHPSVARGAQWLRSVRQADGGWGEDERSYAEGRYVGALSSQPSQTAWAMLGLMAATDADDPAISGGRSWLERAVGADGTWTDERNAVGFPRVFYLLYHGYPAYFPVLALARLETRERRRGSDVQVGAGDPPPWWGRRSDHRPLVLPSISRRRRSPG